MPGAESPLAALEALIFSSAETVGQAELKRALGWTPGQIAAGVQDINKQLETTGRPYEIVEVSGGYRFRTRPEFGELLAAAQPEKRVKLSRASLDTLAVIAYRQPVSRPEIEEIRSVDSGAVVRGLLDRGLVRIVGRRDAPGRPAIYGTSSRFLEVFGLSSLRDLPSLRDLTSPDAVEATPIEAAIAAKNGAAAEASGVDAELPEEQGPDDEAGEPAVPSVPAATAAPAEPEFDLDAAAAPDPENRGASAAIEASTPADAIEALAEATPEEGEGVSAEASAIAETPPSENVSDVGPIDPAEPGDAEQASDGSPVAATAADAAEARVAVDDTAEVSVIEAAAVAVDTAEGTVSEAVAAEVDAAERGPDGEQRES